MGSQKAEELRSIPDGAVYDGEFKGGLREGRGVYKKPDGAVYDGEFKGGQLVDRRVDYLLEMLSKLNGL